MAGLYKLVIADDEGKTTVVPLVRDELTIGRKEGNTIRLTERNVSRRHARIFRDGDSFRIEDFTSFNGVKIGGKRIDGPYELRAGDTVVIGDYRLSFQVEGTDGALTQEPTLVTAIPDGPTAVLAVPPPTPVDSARTVPMPPVPPPPPPAVPSVPAPAAPAAAAPAAPSIPPVSFAASPTVGPPARLVMLSAPSPGAEFSLGRPRCRIGRTEELDIWINHRSISREHAEVSIEGEAIHIRDLESANGIRVNGKDVKATALRPGDEVELGQVRLRFVGAGESFVFDRSMIVDIEPPSRMPMYLAGAIVLIAVLAAGIVVMSGSSPTTARPLEGDPVLTPDPAGAETAMRACLSAVSEERYSDALARADEALGLSPGLREAETCRAHAEAGMTWERGLMAYMSNDMGQAYTLFRRLPEDSPFRTRAQVRDARDQYVSRTMEQAQAATDRTTAISMAREVLAIPDLEPAVRAQAEALLTEPSPTVAVVDHPPTTPTPTPPQQRTNVGTGAGGTATGARPPSAGTTGTATGGAARPTGRTTPTRPTTAVDTRREPAGLTENTPEQRAQVCAGSGDWACVIDELPRPSTESQYFLHLTALRLLHAPATRICPMVDAYLRRFPTANQRHVAQYRQYQQAQCQ